MALSNFIQKLQNKPRHVRVIIMWAGVAVFMTALFIFWVATLDIGRHEKSTEPATGLGEASPLSEAKKNIPSLWNSLSAGITDLFDSEIQESQPGVQSSDGQKSAPKIEIGEPRENTVPPSSLPNN